METLVLDANYRPITIFPFGKAIRKVMSERAEVLERFTDEEIGREWKGAMECPSVIRLLHFVQKPRKHNIYQRLTRQNVLIRDNYCCQYCGCHLNIKTLSWDHIVPRDKGGKSTWTNLVSACQHCNVKKGNKSLQESGLHLKKKPVAPLKIMGVDEFSFFSSLKNFPSERWKSYLYFNTELDA